MFFLATPGEYMLPFEDLVKGNPSIEMMKQVVVTAMKRPEFPAAFIVETVSVFHPRNYCLRMCSFCKAHVYL